MQAARRIYALFNGEEIAVALSLTSRMRAGPADVTGERLIGRVAEVHAQG
jgi:hypothetical protein